MPAGADWVDCHRQPEGCSKAKSTGNERIKQGAGAAMPRLCASGWKDRLWRWRGKLTDEASKGPGEHACLGCRRVRLAPDMSKIPPACGRIFFNSARGGACWCTRGRVRSQGPGRCRAGKSPQGRGRSPRCPKLQARSADPCIL